MEKHCENIWDIWYEIALKVSQMHPQYEFAFVVDTASALFNEEESLSNSQLAI
jgi:hypothetical protein